MWMAKCTSAQHRFSCCNAAVAKECETCRKRIVRSETVFYSMDCRVPRAVVRVVPRGMTHGVIVMGTSWGPYSATAFPGTVTHSGSHNVQRLSFSRGTSAVQVQGAFDSKLSLRGSHGYRTCLVNFPKTKLQRNHNSTTRPQIVNDVFWRSKGS